MLKIVKIKNTNNVKGKKCTTHTAGNNHKTSDKHKNARHAKDVLHAENAKICKKCKNTKYKKYKKSADQKDLNELRNKEYIKDENIQNNFFEYFQKMKKN